MSRQSGNYAKIRRLLLLMLLGFLSACSWSPRSYEYRRHYAYLKRDLPTGTISDADHYLVLLVNARHLDYTNGASLIRTLAKHPSDGTKNGDVGHAWIMLHGVVDGRHVHIEGGHSGELGRCQPRYFDGVAKYAAEGEDNPVKYLWKIQEDGFFQKGSGGHCPTLAVKVNLTPDQFRAIFQFIDPRYYNYAAYSLTGSQCCTFLVEAAKIAGISLESEVKIPIPATLSICGENVTLWQDPQYATLALSSPDRLEYSLLEALREGKVENATCWYLKRHYRREQIGAHLRKALLFPRRYSRYLKLASATAVDPG